MKFWYFLRIILKQLENGRLSNSRSSSMFAVHTKYIWVLVLGKCIIVLHSHLRRLSQWNKCLSSPTHIYALSAKVHDPPSPSPHFTIPASNIVHHKHTSHYILCLCGYHIGNGFILDNFKKYWIWVSGIFLRYLISDIVLTDSTLAGMAKYCHTSINCWALLIFNCFDVTPIPFCHNHTLLSYQYVVSFMGYRYRVSDFRL